MDLDEEIDQLYGGPPDEFVASRDALAKRLRAEGDRERAKTVKDLRRPTVAAWGVNLVARHDPDGVRALLEAGDALARAQRRALSGVRDSGLRDAATQRRAAVTRLVDRAVTLLDEAGANGAAHRDAMVATFEAASSSPEAADVVRRGRLSRELDAPSGFGEVGGLSLVAPEPEPAPAAAGPGSGSEGAPSEEDREAAERAEERRRLEAAVADARETLEARRAAAAEAERDASAARRDADAAAEKADQAEAEADRLEREAAAARREAERARRRASRADDEAEERRELAARRRRSAVAADEALDEVEEALRAAARE